ncbi:elongation of very long chain fatty acids protein 3 [Folsomia candida]|uniref:Elongation of very long chain fatty acids protein n=1 Tax=Folsomia candida TaxID=158441 RepID=A0A226F4F7_FOLCA|nr:elongation of very long chain fatty acids protein 3 [Folsomia candida]OXA64337.1 putative fatty acid elongation protein 3 [Folsomia candida]
MEHICDTSAMSHVNLDSDPTYMKLYSFEKFPKTWRIWGWCNWTVGIYASILYLVILLVGIRLMKNRPPFRLQSALIGWNLGLSAFSVIFFSRSLPEIINAISSAGVLRSFCKLENPSSATYFWGLIFCIFKIIEFGDTAFIVLRKQKLIFLHWYHHLTVCIYGSFVWSTYDPAGRYFYCMNAFVHAIMYFYYGLRAANMKPPKYLSIVITSIQIMQMFVGIVISLFTSYVILTGGECDRPWSNIGVALAMYFSYCALFLNFFYQRYLRSAKKMKVM